jgi:hypothetical protein
MCNAFYRATATIVRQNRQPIRRQVESLFDSQKGTAFCDSQGANFGSFDHPPTAFLSPSIKRLGRDGDISPYLVRRLKVCGSLPPFLSYVFNGAVQNTKLCLYITGLPKVSAWTHLQWLERCYSHRSTMTTFRCLSTADNSYLLLYFALDWTAPLKSAAQ